MSTYGARTAVEALATSPARAWAYDELERRPELIRPCVACDYPERLLEPAGRHLGALGDAGIDVEGLRSDALVYVCGRCGRVCVLLVPPTAL